MTNLVKEISRWNRKVLSINCKLIQFPLSHEDPPTQLYSALTLITCTIHGPSISFTSISTSPSRCFLSWLNPKPKKKLKIMYCFFIYFKSIFKKIKLFYILYFKLIFLNYFDVLILKIIFKKYYFNIFSNKKYFKNHL